MEHNKKQPEERREKGEERGRSKAEEKSRRRDKEATSPLQLLAAVSIAARGIE